MNSEEQAQRYHDLSRDLIDQRGTIASQGDRIAQLEAERAGLADEVRVLKDALGFSDDEPPSAVDAIGILRSLRLRALAFSPFVRVFDNLECGDIAKALDAALVALEAK